MVLANFTFVVSHLSIHPAVPQPHYGAGLFRKKTSKKSTCAVMIRIIINLGNQIFL